MQIGYQVRATPFGTLLAVIVALAALLLTGALGYGLGQARGAGHAITAPTSVAPLAFPYGPADRAGEPSLPAFPHGPADRAGNP